MSGVVVKWLVLVGPSAARPPPPPLPGLLGARVNAGKLTFKNLRVNLVRPMWCTAGVCGQVVYSSPHVCDLLCDWNTPDVRRRRRRIVRRHLQSRTPHTNAHTHVSDKLGLRYVPVRRNPCGVEWCECVCVFSLKIQFIYLE